MKPMTKEQIKKIVELNTMKSIGMALRDFSDRLAQAIYNAIPDLPKEEQFEENDDLRQFKIGWNACIKEMKRKE